MRRRIRKFGEPIWVHFWNRVLDALEAFSHEIDEGSRALLDQPGKGEDYDV
jgi:hypothetical protein